MQITKVLTGNYCFLANMKGLCGPLSRARGIKVILRSSARKKYRISFTRLILSSTQVEENKFFFCIIAHGSEIFELTYCREKFNTKFMITHFLIMENPT